MKQQENVPLPYIGIVIGVIAVSTASVLIRMSRSSALVIASYRLLFATLILLPFFLIKKGIKEFKTLSLEVILSFIGVGIALAAHFGFWITSLTLTSVASSVVLVNSSPIFVSSISYLYLGERGTKRTWIGTIIAFLGVVMISFKDLELGKGNLLGDIFSLLGALMLAIYLLAGRKIRKNLGLLTYVTPIYAISSLTLIICCILTGNSLIPNSIHEVLLFLILAVVPMIFGHTVYNWALKYVETPIVSVSLLGEPLGAILLATIFLHEIPSITTIIGGIITLLGICLVISPSLVKIKKQ